MGLRGECALLLVIIPDFPIQPLDFRVRPFGKPIARFILKAVRRPLLFKRFRLRPQVFLKRRELLLRRIDGALRRGFPLIQRLIRAPRRVDLPLAVCRRLMRRVDARRQPLPRLVRPDFQRPQAVFPLIQRGLVRRQPRCRVALRLFGGLAAPVRPAPAPAG